MSKDIKALERLIRENIKGSITKKALKEWFLDVQAKEQQGFCLSIPSTYLYKLAEGVGIKVVDKEKEIKGEHSVTRINEVVKEIPINTNFKFTKEQFIDLYLNKLVKQCDIAKELKVSNNTINKAILVFGLPERPRGRSKLNNIVLTKNLLQELYINQNLTRKKIAEITDKKLTTVGKYLNKYKLMRSVQYE